MAKEIPIQNKKLSDFISDIEEQGKIQNYLRKKKKLLHVKNSSHFKKRLCDRT